MNVLDRLFFYLWGKFYEICLRISFKIDEIAGFDIPDGEDVEEEENDER